MKHTLWVAIPVIVLTVLATRTDLRTRKIPNVLTGSALLLGLLFHLVIGGPAEAGRALLGALVAGTLLFPGWIMGFMGAGDVKLMAAVGAWLVYPMSLLAALMSLIAGGGIALLVCIRRRALVSTLRNTWQLGLSLLLRSRGLPRAEPVTTGVRFPFAPAVLAGAAFVLWRSF